MRRIAGLVAVLFPAVVLTGCADPPPPTVPWPDGVRVHVDQSRVERKGREVFVRVGSADDDLTVVRARLTSPRFPDALWTGDEVVEAGYETDLEIDLPQGRCGTSVDTTVVLDLRVGDGPLRRAATAAPDPYGAVALLLDRDCAQTALESAATVTLGRPRVSGTGPDSTLTLPVTLAPTPRAAGVTFLGFESTVLFRQVSGSADDVAVPVVAGGAPTTVELVVVPARCDPHALAEDKVGTLFGVEVAGPDVPAGSAYFLPLGQRRSAFLDFFRSHCGL